MPGTAGVDGLLHSWQGEFPWIFPPFNLIPDVFYKIVTKKVDCCLVLPCFSAVWVARLQELPIRRKLYLKYYRDLYSLGSRVPASWHENKPVYNFDVYLLRFP